MIAGINFNRKAPPWRGLSVASTTLHLKSYCTVSVIVAECVRLPEVPVTVSV